MIRSEKKIYALFLMLTIFLLSGCATDGLMALGSDKTLTRVSGIKNIVSKGSIGFEWQAIRDSRVKGIKIYRAIPDSRTREQRFAKIATIDNKYTTHYVDKDIRSNISYLYMFTTYSLFNESSPSRIIRVHTMQTFAPVDFIKTYMSDHGVVKVLWNPHPNPQIDGYILERKIDGGDWKFLALVNSRLMPEYVDESAAIGRRYSYRIIAKTSEGIKSEPSAASSITVE